MEKKEEKKEEVLALEIQGLRKAKLYSAFRQDHVLRRGQAPHRVETAIIQARSIGASAYTIAGITKLANSGEFAKAEPLTEDYVNRFCGWYIRLGLIK